MHSFDEQGALAPEQAERLNDGVLNAFFNPNETAQAEQTEQAEQPESAATEVKAAAVPGAAFAALGLAAPLLAAVQELGFEQPTEVQQRAIPLCLDRAQDPASDLMVSSQTGSGKTAAFLLPVLHRLLALAEEEKALEQTEWQARVDEAMARGEPLPKKPKRKSPLNPRHFKPARPGALVLTPTRELAQQVGSDAIDLVRHCRGLRVATVVGGLPYREQIARLQNADLVVATPGRLLDLQRNGQIQLDRVRFWVVDEADRMLDLGFADDLAEVHQLCAGREQTMMFSATFDAPIQQLALRVMRDQGAHVKRIQVAQPQQRHANIRQELYWADNPMHKRALLDYWLRDPSLQQAIVFACTQIECDELAQDLQQDGFAAVALHGAMNQGLRNRRLTALRSGRVQILVATDVAARGIDVPAISHVINYGLPMKAEDYTHRIGRTGRAGREGTALTLAEFRDRRRLADIERFTRQPFEVRMIEGLEPQERFPPINQERKPKGRGGPARHGGPRGAGAGFGRAPGRDAERRFDGPGAGRGFDRGSERSWERGPSRGFDDGAPAFRGKPAHGKFAHGKPARADGRHLGQPGHRPAHAAGARPARGGAAPAGRPYAPGRSGR